MVADPGDFFGLPPARVAVVLVDFQNDFCSPLVAGGGPVRNTGNAAAAVRANRFPRRRRPRERRSSTPARCSTPTG